MAEDEVERNQAGCPVTCQWAGKCMFAPEYPGCRRDVKEYLREHPDRKDPSSDNSKPVLPSVTRVKKETPPEKRKKKEKIDPVCADCWNRHGGNGPESVPAHACAACKAELKEKGRRAWITSLPLGTVHLGDIDDLGEHPFCETEVRR